MPWSMAYHLIAGGYDAAAMEKSEPAPPPNCVNCGAAFEVGFVACRYCNTARRGYRYSEQLEQPQLAPSTPAAAHDPPPSIYEAPAPSPSFDSGGGGDFGGGGASGDW